MKLKWGKKFCVSRVELRKEEEEKEEFFMDFSSHDAFVCSGVSVLRAFVYVVYIKILSSRCVTSL
jgi:hypothetical protein